MKKNIKHHVKIGDRIKIISGKSKGKIGNILSINSKKKTVIVDSVDRRIKLLVARDGESPKQVELTIPIHISNVMLWDSNNNIASKIGWKITKTTEDNKVIITKQRFFKKSGNVV